MITKLKKFVKDERGISAVDTALLLLAIVLAATIIFFSVQSIVQYLLG